VSVSVCLYVCVCVHAWAPGPHGRRHGRWESHAHGHCGKFKPSLSTILSLPEKQLAAANVRRDGGEREGGRKSSGSAACGFIRSSNTICWALCGLSFSVILFYASLSGGSCGFL
jgi:hypothetical protein